MIWIISFKKLQQYTGSEVQRFRGSGFRVQRRVTLNAEPVNV